MPQDSPQLVPAARLGRQRIAALLNRAYAGYAIDLNFTAELVESLVAVQSVDLDASCVLVRGSDELGVALVARRGGRARLAAFGIVAEERRRGLGDWLGRAVLQAVCARGAERLELEVLAQNVGAIALYRRLGFSEVERLLGFEGPPAALDGDGAGVEDLLGAGDLPTATLADVAAAVAEEWSASGDGGALPWQIAPETIVRMPKLRGFRVGRALGAARETPNGSLGLFALALGGSTRADARSLVERLRASAGAGRLVAPPLFPESHYRPHFEGLGFQITELSQLHMTLSLEGLR